MTEKFDPRFDAAFQPGFADKRGRAARPERSTNPAKAALEAAREHAEQVIVDVDTEHEIGARRPNPFLIALLVLSLALITGGISAVQAVRSFFSTQDISADMDYITYQMLIYAAPISIALGIAIAAGVLFIYAINWHKRP
jgi:hypothetical protein